MPAAAVVPGVAAVPAAVHARCRSVRPPPPPLAPTASLCPPAMKAALLAFKARGDPDNALASWDPATDPCSS